MELTKSYNNMNLEIQDNQNVLKVDIKSFIFILQNMAYLLNDPVFAELKKSEDVRFIGACLSNLNQTVSQNFQDIFVIYETLQKRDGYFVEFGATDGKTISNTFILEKYFGWKGILAEPNPYWHKALEENRTCHISKKCVYSNSNETIEFVNSNAPDLSGIKDFIDNKEKNNGSTVNVETISLIDLLDGYDAPSDIDYLSIDTEGSEYNILESFFRNNTKYNINLMTVEHNYDNDNRLKLLNLMQENGYKRKFESVSRCDDFYVKVR